MDEVDPQGCSCHQTCAAVCIRIRCRIVRGRRQSCEGRALAWERVGEGLVRVDCRNARTEMVRLASKTRVLAAGVAVKSLCDDGVNGAMHRTGFPWGKLPGFQPGFDFGDVQVAAHVGSDGRVGSDIRNSTVLLTMAGIGWPRRRSGECGMKMMSDGCSETRAQPA